MEVAELVVVADDVWIEVAAVDRTPTQKGAGDGAGDGGVLVEIGEAVETAGRRQQTFVLKTHVPHWRSCNKNGV